MFYHSLNGISLILSLLTFYKRCPKVFSLFRRSFKKIQIKRNNFSYIMEENIVIMNPFNSTFLCSTSLMHTWVCPVGGSNAFKVRLNRMFSVFDKEWWMQHLLHITYVYRLILNFLWFYDKLYTHMGYFYSGNVSYLLKASHLYV